MARKPRRTVLEKLRDELQEVQQTMEQYEESLAALGQREKEIQELILSEQTKDLVHLMEDHDMSMEELKELVASSRKSSQEVAVTAG